MKNVIVTGGAGFIGSNFVRLALAQKPEWRIIVVDALTYAGNLENLAGTEEAFPGRYRFVKADIVNAKTMEKIFLEETPALVVHFAAESHVDRSVLGPMDFVRTNVLGTATLLEAARKAWREKPGRFLQVSTDEVYGALGETEAFTETTPVSPSSPYSASKASADMLALAYHKTFGLDVVITRCCNNYGPYQFPEKLIPFMIARFVDGENLPVYGNGMNVRDWIHVDDHNRGVILAIERGRSGEVYNLGARCERKNIDLVRSLSSLLFAAKGVTGGNPEERIAFVKDRPGHDWRYAIDPSKAERELGFRPHVSFGEGLSQTVAWYLKNEQWWRGVQSGAYRDYVAKVYGE